MYYTSSGNLIVKTSNSSIDLVMNTYTATTCNGVFALISCNDDYNGIISPRIQMTGLQPGGILYIRIFNFQFSAIASATFKMCVTEHFNIDVINNNAKVGIGTITPSAKLDVAGSGIFRDTVIFAKTIDLRSGIKIRSEAGNGKVLTSDANGNAIWLPPALQANYWSLTAGNIHNNNAGGNVGIGTNSPSTAKLVIGGSNGTEGIDLASSDQYANM